MFEHKSVTSVFENAKIISFDNSSKIVLMSDCHRSDGSGSDNFTQNHNIFLAALNHYYHNGYTYIEIGDGDELWENKYFSDILYNNNKVFEILADFHKKDRLFMIFGNHDIVKNNAKWTRENLNNYLNECGDNTYMLFPKAEIYEGLLLTHRTTNNQLFLLHGHQVDRLNYDFWKLARFLVRYLWRPLELIGIKDPTSTINNHAKKSKVEEHLKSWSNKKNLIVIAGHTHKPVFPDVGEPLYFNDGACVYPQYITAIEITNNELSLVRWVIKVRNDGVLYVGKDILKGPVLIDEYYIRK